MKDIDQTFSDLLKNDMEQDLLFDNIEDSIMRTIHEHRTVHPKVQQLLARCKTIISIAGILLLFLLVCISTMNNNSVPTSLINYVYLVSLLGAGMFSVLLIFYTSLKANRE